MTQTPRPELPAADRPEVDWNDPRRAITHALGCGPRLGWVAVEGALAEAEVAGRHGIGDAVTVTFTRGNGSVRQTVTAIFRVMITTPRTPVDFYRYVGGFVDLADGAGPQAVRTWGQIMGPLYSTPRKARRAPKGAKAGAARRARSTRSA